MFGLIRNSEFGSRGSTNVIKTSYSVFARDDAKLRIVFLVFV